MHAKQYLHRRGKIVKNEYEYCFRSPVMSHVNRNNGFFLHARTSRLSINGLERVPARLSLSIRLGPFTAPPSESLIDLRRMITEQARVQKAGQLTPCAPSRLNNTV